ncbi:MAG TPA: TIM barrel protein [Anaerolineales bacterium]|nr:TIM barrel protein [Anaerolineales bacterium]
MKIIFGKSKWEMWDDSLEIFLQRASASGFEATEIYLGSLDESPAEIAQLHTAHGLSLIGQILTEGESYRDHIKSLEAQFEFAAQCQVAFINSHTGRDIFSFEENVQIFQRLIQLSQSSGIRILIETHRGRPTYSAIETRKYLEAIRELRLTADFSHWMVVHESDLADQRTNMELAIARADYIHARVGYAEGPQIPDPRAPEWQGAVTTHLELWQQIIDQHKTDGKESLYITPEFGPPAYMHTIPFTNQPVGDVWEQNVYMKDLLASKLKT